MSVTILPGLYPYWTAKLDLHQGNNLVGNPTQGTAVSHPAFGHPVGNRDSACAAHVYCNFGNSVHAPMGGG